VIARHVRAQLEAEDYPVLKAEMVNRVAYPETGIDGLAPSVTDPDGAAARDIAAIAQELQKLAGVAVKLVARAKPKPKGRAEKVRARV
jgi:chromosome partitioning protein